MTDGKCFEMAFSKKMVVADFNHDYQQIKKTARLLINI